MPGENSESGNVYHVDFNALKKQPNENSEQPKDSIGELKEISDFKRKIPLSRFEHVSNLITETVHISPQTDMEHYWESLLNSLSKTGVYKKIMNASDNEIISHQYLYYQLLAEAYRLGLVDN
jgi:hypothetical protein